MENSKRLGFAQLRRPSGVGSKLWWRIRTHPLPPPPVLTYPVLPPSIKSAAAVAPRRRRHLAPLPLAASTVAPLLPHPVRALRHWFPRYEPLSHTVDYSNHIRLTSANFGGCLFSPATSIRHPLPAVDARSRNFARMFVQAQSILAYRVPYPRSVRQSTLSRLVSN